jgi:hypothetical protein
MSGGTFGFKGFKDRALELPAGVTSALAVAVAPGGRARLRYNDVAKQLEQSIDGGAYTPLGGTGAGPWDQVGTDVFPDSTGWNVTIGAAAVVGTERLRVVGTDAGLGGIRIESNPAFPSCYLEMNEGDGASVSAADEGRLRYSKVNQRFEVSEDGGAYVPISADSGPWDETAGVVSTDNVAWNVVVGAAAMLGSEKLRVVGDVRAEGDVFITSAGELNFDGEDAGAAYIRPTQRTAEGAQGRLMWIYGGAGGDSVGTGSGGDGNTLALFGGPGGANAPGQGAGDGGKVIVRGGQGGVQSGGNAGGQGGDASLEGGEGTPGSATPVNGGDAIVRGGGGFSGGNDGNVRIGSLTTASVVIGNVGDNPPTNFLGTGVVSIGAGQLVVGAPGMVGAEKLRVVGAARIEGKLTVTGLIDPTGLVVDEQSTVPGGAPGAAKGTFWVKDDSPNKPYFTDDAGTDHDLLAGGTGTVTGTGTDRNIATWDAAGTGLRDNPIAIDAAGDIQWAAEGGVAPERRIVVANATGDGQDADGLYLETGDGAASTTTHGGIGGAVRLTSGAGGTTTNAASRGGKGGTITIGGGAGGVTNNATIVGGGGGDCNLSAGPGGESTGSGAGGTGGQFYASGGLGGDSSGTGDGGAGGSVLIEGGNGGFCPSGQRGPGGDCTVQGGAGHIDGPTVGGDLFLYGGEGYPLGASPGTGGNVTMAGGPCATTGVGGDVTINGGAGGTTNGDVGIGLANTANIAIGNTGDNAPVNFLGTGLITINSTFARIDPSDGGSIWGATSRDASALLQADSTTKGFLPPRMTRDQRNLIGSPATGLEVHNTSGSLDFYDGTQWREVAPLIDAGVVPGGGSYSASVDELVRVSSSLGSPTTVTLPTAVNASMRAVTIKEVAGNAGTINVNTTGGQTIDGTAGPPADTFATAYGAATYISDGTNWMKFT